MIDDLKAFVAVVNMRSLTKAADKLCLTQSAISRRLQQLEERLGGLLLDRSIRPPCPTPLGHRVYEKALPVLKAVEALIDLSREDAAPTGTLRLGVTHALGEMLSSRIVERMKGAFPTLDVRLSAEWSAGLCKRIVAGDIDAAAILTHPSNTLAAPTVGRHVATLDIVIVQSRRLPLVKGPVPMSRLAGEGWILNPQGCGYRAELEQAIGATAGGLRVVVDTFGAELQLRMIASGLGLGVVPRSVLKASVTREGLSIVDVLDFSMKLDVWIVHKQDVGNLRRAVDLLVETTGAAFAPPSKGSKSITRRGGGAATASKPKAPRRRRPGEDSQ